MEHQLTVKLPQQPLLIDADLIRLAQVFSNLLTNAAKYSDRGSQIRLTVERHGSDVLSFGSRTQASASPPTNWPRIFDMFSQVDHSLERSCRAGWGSD